jgi:hypothetical protein
LYFFSRELCIIDRAGIANSNCYDLSEFPPEVLA